MFLFAHVGVTLGVSVLATGAVSAMRRAGSKRGGRSLPWTSPDAGHAASLWLGHVESWLAVLGGVLNTRMILIGSLLPDIIDKPLGTMLLRETLGNGKIFGHTLVFLGVLGLTGLYQYRRSSRSWLLALALGTGVHLVLDTMWQWPRTLLWPAYGLAFDKGDVSGWMQGVLRELLTNPAYYVPEIIGVIVLGWFSWNLLRRRKFLAFVWRGEVV